MLVILQTVLDSEEHRNLALSKEIQRRGHDFMITVHSARHLRFYKRAGIGHKCIFCQDKIAAQVKGFLKDSCHNNPDSLLSRTLRTIHETVTPSELDRACRDDYLFIEKPKIIRKAHFAAVFEFYNSFFSKIIKAHSPLCGTENSFSAHRHSQTAEKHQGPAADIRYVSEMGYLYRHAAEMAAVRHGLSPILIESARIPGRIALLDRDNHYNWKGLDKKWALVEPMSIDRLEKEFPIDIAQARDFLERFDKKGMVAASDGWGETRKFSLKKIFNILDYLIRHYIEERCCNPYTDFLTVMKKSLKRKIQCSLFNIKTLKDRLYTSADHVSKHSEKYAFFPLPVPWETTIRWRAPKFDNHLKSIKYVRSIIPEGLELFVKEHPVDTGGTPIKELLEINSIRGVSLLDPSIDSRKLIKGSCLLITVNGTAGLEALFFNKRPITLAPAFYEVFNLSARPGLNPHNKDIISIPCEGPKCPDDFLAQYSMKALKIVTAMIMSSKKAHFDYSTGPEFKKYMKNKNIKTIVDSILDN